MKEIMEKKESTITIKYVDTGVINKAKSSHLCGDCKNCSPSYCKKVANVTKKPIDQYPFITDGMSIGEKNPDIIVTGCENFEKDKRRGVNDRRNKVNNLYKLYYGTEEIDEALKEDDYYQSEAYLKRFKGTK